MTRIVRSEKGVQRTILLMILVSVVIATISLAGILNLYFAGAPSSQISTSVVASMPGDQLESPPSTSTIGASSILSTNGLRLTASISSAEVKVTQSLNISVSLFNTLPTISSVPPSNLTSFQGFPIALWPTCFGYPPVTFVVLSGNYSLDALRADANATGSSPSVACAEYGMKYGMIINNLVFQPSSDQAVLTGVFVTAVGSDLNATRDLTDWPPTSPWKATGPIPSTARRLRTFSHLSTEAQARDSCTLRPARSPPTHSWRVPTRLSWRMNGGRSNCCTSRWSPSHRHPRRRSASPPHPRSSLQPETRVIQHHRARANVTARKKGALTEICCRIDRPRGGSWETRTLKSPHSRRDARSVPHGSPTYQEQGRELDSRVLNIFLVFQRSFRDEVRG